MVKNPKALVYISGQNKIQFFNSVDDVLDSIEDLASGEIEGFTHFKKLTGKGTPIQQYLIPDHITLFSILLKKLQAQFTSSFNIVIGLAAVILAPNVSSLDYQSMAIAVVSSFTVISIISSVVSAARLGLF